MTELIRPLSPELTAAQLAAAGQELLRDRDFAALRELMYQYTGVYLRPSKRRLVITRLRRRLEALGLADYEAYVAVLRRDSAEREEFINAITTNETYFFRHTKQFNFLFEHVFPAIAAERETSGSRSVRVWSAACSTGEEPYSLAIALREFFASRPRWRWQVFASDINSSVLGRAAAGSYAVRSLRYTPARLQQRYFHAAGARLEVAAAIREAVAFSRHNLLKPFAQRQLDIVFLRNVMIYFDLPSKAQVIAQLQASVRPGGYVFIGLSENLNDVDAPLEYIGAGIYRKRGG